MTKTAPFTVKWVHLGKTKILPAIRIEVDTIDGPDGGQVVRAVKWDRGDGGKFSEAKTGTVYVMNEAGKTIDTFNMPSHEAAAA